MGILKKMFNSFVYNHTNKPKHYVHVDKPKTLQDHRQIQFNNWSKRHGIYSGSYLPKDPNTLNKKGKGWKEDKGKPNKSVRNFHRLSSNQKIRYDAGVKFNPDDVIFVTKDKNNQMLWLEKGDNHAGLEHIIKKHEKDFNDKLGISSKEIQSTIKDIVTSGEIQYSRIKITNGKKGYEKLYLYKKNIILFLV